jgi:hypothetical protein
MCSTSDARLRRRELVLHQQHYPMKNNCVECYGGPSVRLDEVENIIITIVAGIGTLMLRVHI